MDYHGSDSSNSIFVGAFRIRAYTSPTVNSFSYLKRVMVFLSYIIVHGTASQAAVRDDSLWVSSKPPPTL